MWVENFDGGYEANDPRDFCVHGTYVGGCGYDFMCFRCEMEEPDVDEFDILYQQEYIYTDDKVTGVAYTAYNGYGSKVTLGLSGIAASGPNEGKHLAIVFPIDKSGVNLLGFFTSVEDIEGMMRDMVRAWILTRGFTW